MTRIAQLATGLATSSFLLVVARCIAGATMERRWGVVGAPPRLQWSAARSSELRRGCNGAHPGLQWSAAGVVGAPSRLQWIFAGDVDGAASEFFFAPQCSTAVRGLSSVCN
ncbi:hypothetical protein VPH35_065957 [Triticum aestivum]